MNELLLNNRNLSFFEKQEKITRAGLYDDSCFGHAVSINANGTYAAITAFGETYNRGTVYIYKLDGSTWAFQAKLEASNKETGDMFGCSVCISDDGATVVIGAERKSTRRGAAYVFRRNSSSWFEDQYLIAWDGAVDDYFGYAVTISGDGNYIAISALYDDDRGAESGSVYIYKKNPTAGWMAWVKINSSDGAAVDMFGSSVSLNYDGSILTATSQLANVSDGRAGALYIFTRNVETWTQVAKITAPGGKAYDYFGYSSSISGDGNTIAVSSHCSDDSGVDSGSVFIYTRSGSNWSLDAKILPNGGKAHDYFGLPVDISYDGKMVLIGAHGDDDTALNAGAAYIYSREGAGNWHLLRKILPTSSGDGDMFGFSVSLSGDGLTALVGARWNDAIASNAGAAYVIT